MTTMSNADRFWEGFTGGGLLGGFLGDMVFILLITLSYSVIGLDKGIAIVISIVFSMFIGLIVIRKANFLSRCQKMIAMSVCSRGIFFMLLAIFAGSAVTSWLGYEFDLTRPITYSSVLYSTPVMIRMGMFYWLSAAIIGLANIRLIDWLLGMMTVDTDPAHAS